MKPHLPPASPPPSPKPRAHEGRGARSQMWGGMLIVLGIMGLILAGATAGRADAAAWAVGVFAAAIVAIGLLLLIAGLLSRRR